MKKILFFILIFCATFTLLYSITYIIRKNFIYDILGTYKDDNGAIVPLTEEALRARYLWSPANPIQKNFLGGGNIANWYKPKVNERRAAIFQGTFHTNQAIVKTAGYDPLTIYTGLSVKELESKVQDKKFPGKPSFTIIFYDPLQPHFGDIRYLQTLPELKGATFQLASTFNCLEGGMGDDLTQARTKKITTVDPVTGKNKTKIEVVRTGGPDLIDMIPRAVQGEEAAIACAGATLYRKYCMPPVNLLYRLPGIAMRPDKGFDALTYTTLVDIGKGKINAGALKSNDVAIGLHQNLVVTSGYGEGSGKDAEQIQMPIALTADGAAVDVNKTQIVSQVFGAACNLGSIRLNKDWASYAPNITKFCQLVLNGVYDGTLRAAALTDKPDVFLTLMGGGAFRNDMKWILEALLGTAHIIQHHNLNVVLIYRPDKIRSEPVVRTVQGDVEFLKEICDFAAATINGVELVDKELHQNIERYVAASYDITDETKAADKENNTNIASQHAKLLQQNFPHKIFQTTHPVLPPADKPVGTEKELISALSGLTESLRVLEARLAG